MCKGGERKKCRAVLTLTSLPQAEDVTWKEPLPGAVDRTMLRELAVVPEGATCGEWRQAPDSHVRRQWSRCWSRWPHGLAGTSGVQVWPRGTRCCPLGDGAVRELPQEDLRSREDSVSKDLPGVDEKHAGRAGSKAKEVPCVGQGAAGRPQCGGSPRTPAVMTKTSVPVP